MNLSRGGSGENRVKEPCQRVKEPCQSKNRVRCFLLQVSDHSGGSLLEQSSLNDLPIQETERALG